MIVCPICGTPCGLAVTVKLNGFDVLRRIRSDARTRVLPVIVLTGVTSSHEIDRARSTGADRCLSKPIDVAEFLGVLREVTASTRASGTAG